MNKKKEYHILSLSGGKDSTALAFFMRENMPEIFEKLELVFCDTEHEIPETYEYLNKIELFLNKPITRLKPKRSFEDILATTNFLPSHKHRWCTGLLKNNSLNNYVKMLRFMHNYTIIKLYLGIRNDEIFRISAAGQNPYLIEIFPFVENNIYKNDVENILKNAGIGISDYYKWRKRSGCYFCFYQSCMDWLRLYENHPDLYKRAMEYEYNDCKEIKSGRMGFNMDYSLRDMIKPENIKIIKENYQKSQENKHNKNLSTTLFNSF